MNIMLDTGTLMDCLTQRGKFFASTRKLLILGALKEYDLWLSATQIPDLNYLLSGGNDPGCVGDARRRMKVLLRNVHVCSVGEPEIEAALDLPRASFDAALLHEVASKLKADCIVSADIKRFAGLPIRILDPDAFFIWLDTEHSTSFSEIAF